MQILAAYSLLILFLVKIDSPEILRFSLKPFLKFLFILAAITAIRLYSFVGIEEPFYSNPYNIPDLLFVYWEDTFFVLPLLIMKKYQRSSDGINGFIFWTTMILSSFFFAAGHLYISTEWAAILLGYVPLMYYIARKSGLANVILGHILYDFATVLTAVYGWSLVNV